jgi:beta-glucanase (GH16 family)
MNNDYQKLQLSTIHSYNELRRGTRSKRWMIIVGGLLVAVVLLVCMVVVAKAAFNTFRNISYTNEPPDTGIEEVGSNHDGMSDNLSAGSSGQGGSSASGGITSGRSSAGASSAGSSGRSPARNGSSGSESTGSGASGNIGSGQTSARGDACGPAIPKYSGGYWSCVFNDDFNGNSLNTANWSVAVSPNDFFQFFECYANRPENVSVGNGVLTLTSRREIPQLPCGFLGGRDFSGGMVRTLNKQHLNRGKVEIRAKFPPSKGQYGIGTSLWMFHVPSGGNSDAGSYGKWPASGEIDIAEQYAPFDNYVNPSLHYNVKSGHRLQSSCGQENYNAETVTARCLVNGATTGFHTYGMEWTNNTITMLYDGKPVLVDKWNSTQGGSAPFDRPFYLNITQGFSNLPIPGPYNAILPASSQIDYVKIWQ